MQIEATIEKKLSVETYNTKDGEKQKQTLILKTVGQYPKTVAVQIDPSKVNVSNLTYVIAHVNIESREYNGKYYTNVTAWKIEGKEAPKVEDVKVEESSDDLPF